MYWGDSGLEHIVQANYDGTSANIIADNDRSLSSEIPLTFDETG